MSATNCLSPCGDPCQLRGMRFNTINLNIPLVVGVTTYQLPWNNQLDNILIYGWSIPEPDPAASNNVYVSQSRKAANEEVIKSSYLTLKYKGGSGDHHQAIRLGQSLRMDDGIFPEPGLEADFQNSVLNIYNRDAITAGEAVQITLYYKENC